MNPASEFQVPERFQVQELLVENDAEVVYRAVDRTLLREVILKRPGPGLERTLLETGDADRALREARALAQVQHPGVARLIDVIECPGGPLLVMEPIAGETLADRLEREGALAPEQVARLGAELAGALAAVHEIGAVHRGLSTANILIKPDGSACLAGFLFAKFSKASMGISSISYSARPDWPDRPNQPDEAPRVRPSHPAPEQLYGQSADARSDLFGLGCVLFWALTGRDPFGNMLANGWTPPIDPRQIRREVPKPLAAIVLKCLARSPLGRYQSAAELSDALAESMLEKRSPVRSGPWVRYGSLAALLLVLAVAGFLLFDRDEPAGMGFRGAPPELARTEREKVGEYSASFGKSYALLIGINEYQDPYWRRLANAERDITDLEGALLAKKEWEDWEVRRLKGEDATWKGISDALEDLEKKAGRDDRILIYFAGHGVSHEYSDESGWLIPFDGLHQSAEAPRSERNWLHFDDINRFFTHSRAKHILLSMDCCFSGIAAQGTRGSVEAESYSEAYLTRKAHIILAAGRRDQEVADGNAGGHSPFAQAFLDALEREETALTSSELFVAIQKYCRQNGLEQVPVLEHVKGSDGEFVFFLKPR